MTRRRSSGEIAKRIANGPYRPRDSRRQPCASCKAFCLTEEMVTGLGAGVGKFCEPCWMKLAESYANREAGGETLDRYYQRTYGISLEDYGKRYLQQRAACAICLRPPTAEEPLAVDHDHATGAVRGLLCRGCNVGLGCFTDNAAYMGRAIAYLMEAK